MTTLTRAELADEIERYRTLFWGTQDQATRDLLRKILKRLEHQLEALDPPAAAAAEQPQQAIS